MSDKQPLKPNELGDLYPKAKSYDELADERVKVNKVKEAQRPKFVLLRVSVLLTVGCALIAAAIWVLPFLVSANVMTGVFAAFAALLIIAWFVWRAVSRIDYLYSIYGYNTKPFLIIYLVLLAGAIGGLQYIGWDKVTGSSIAIASAIGIHLIATLSLAWLTRGIGKS